MNKSLLFLVALTGLFGLNAKVSLVQGRSFAKQMDYEIEREEAFFLVFKNSFVGCLTGALTISLLKGASLPVQVFAIPMGLLTLRFCVCAAKNMGKSLYYDYKDLKQWYDRTKKQKAKKHIA